MNHQQPTPRHALTVDVEDYFQVTALDGIVAREDWGTIPSRVGAATNRVLDLLARHNVRATFFVLGWIAEHHPEVVRAIDAAGHEIGSHSYWHQQVFRQTPDEFRADLRRSRDVLEQLTGAAVTSYRAPTFSITAESLWALDILIEEGFTVDASIFPVRHDRYGLPDAPLEPHVRETAAGSLWEFPATVAPLAGLRLPIAGGGYFRLLPGGAMRALWRWRQRQTSRPLMFYFHPWELDPEQPNVAGMSRASAWRHRVNLHSTERKLERFLHAFSFGAIGDVLPCHQQALTAEPLSRSERSTMAEVRV